MTTASPIKRHGGKRYLAARIVAMLPPDATHYHEPFFGSGAVLFAKPQAGSETVNDLDGNLIAFWQALRDPMQFERLRRYLELTPMARHEFEVAKLSSDDPVVRAARFFIRNRQSRQALGRDYATPTSRLRRGMNEQVSAWLSAVDGLPAAFERLRTVEIDCLPAVDSIRRRDHAACVHYVDPPYLHSTRTATAAYEHEMNEQQHVELLECLSTLKGKFLLSGYPSRLYAEYAAQYGWEAVTFDLANHASSNAQKHRKHETIWANYPLPCLDSECRTSHAANGS